MQDKRADFEVIPLDKLSVSETINGSVRPIPTLAMYIAAGAEAVSSSHNDIINCTD